MSFLNNAAILPLRSLTSASRLMMGFAIIVTGLALSANNLLILA